MRRLARKTPRCCPQTDMVTSDQGFTSSKRIARGNAAASGEMASTLRETTRAFDDLTLPAETLNGLVSRFKIRSGPGNADSPFI